MFLNVFIILFSYKSSRSDNAKLPSSLIVENAAGVMVHPLTWVKNSSMAELLKVLSSMGMVTGVVCYEGCFTNFCVDISANNE